MIILVNRYLLPKGFIAFAIFPFIFLKTKKLATDQVMINHEKIHLQQQKELLLIFFFIWYAIEFLFYCLKYNDFKKAYRNIRFEREAYENEKDLFYLQKRSLWGFLRN